MRPNEQLNHRPNDWTIHWLNELIDKWLKFIIYIQLDDLKILPSMTKDKTAKYRILTWEIRVFGDDTEKLVLSILRSSILSPPISDGTGDNTLLENITHVAFKLHIPPTLHHNPGPAWQLLAVACLSMSDDIMAKPCVLGCENNWENQQKTPDLSLSNFWQGRLFLENTPNPFFSERTHPIFPERPDRGKALLDSLGGI